MARPQERPVPTCRNITVTQGHRRLRLTVWFDVVRYTSLTFEVRDGHL